MTMIVLRKGEHHNKESVVELFMEVENESDTERKKKKKNNKANKRMGSHIVLMYSDYSLSCSIILHWSMHVCLCVC
ncbi:hypothetical protein ACSBR1_001114 [Camellia fascicularis]